MEGQVQSVMVRLTCCSYMFSFYFEGKMKVLEEFKKQWAEYAHFALLGNVSRP